MRKDVFSTLYATEPLFENKILDLANPLRGNRGYLSEQHTSSELHLTVKAVPPTLPGANMSFWLSFHLWEMDVIKHS
jgi:hypothetical protein